MGDWRVWEDKFIEMWQKFRVGDFKGATEHWNDYNRQRQIDFLRQRRSRNYLDIWLGKL